MRLSCSIFKLLRVFCRKWRILTHPTCICRPRRGWSRSNFALNFGVRKRVTGLSCGVICVIYPLHLAILIQYRSVKTHTQTDRHMTTAYTALSIASRGNYCIDHNQFLQSDRDSQVLTMGGRNMPQTNSRWRTAAILKNRKNLNIFATDWPILTKFCMLMRLVSSGPQ